MKTASGIFKRPAKRAEKPAAWWRVALKMLLVCIILYNLIMIAFFSVEDVSQGELNKRKLDNIEACDHYYYKRDFAGLRETLTLRRLYGEDFAVYWEIADGYDDYVDWLQWSKAEKINLPKSSEKAEYYKNKVHENAENVEFPQNAAPLQELAGQCG